jgi:hypothetical protein
LEDWEGYGRMTFTRIFENQAVDVVWMVLTQYFVLSLCLVLTPLYDLGVLTECWLWQLVALNFGGYIDKVLTLT